MVKSTSNRDPQGSEEVKIKKKKGLSSLLGIARGGGDNKRGLFRQRKKDENQPPPPVEEIQVDSEQETKVSDLTDREERYRKAKAAAARARLKKARAENQLGIDGPPGSASPNKQNLTLDNGMSITAPSPISLDRVAVQTGQSPHSAASSAKTGAIPFHTPKSLNSTSPGNQNVQKSTDLVVYEPTTPEEKTDSLATSRGLDPEPSGSGSVRHDEMIDSSLLAPPNSPADFSLRQSIPGSPLAIESGRQPISPGTTASALAMSPGTHSTTSAKTDRSKKVPLNKVRALLNMVSGNRSQKASIPGEGERTTPRMANVQHNHFAEQPSSLDIVPAREDAPYSASPHRPQSPPQPRATVVSSPLEPPTSPEVETRVAMDAPMDCATFETFESRPPIQSPASDLFGLGKVGSYFFGGTNPDFPDELPDSLPPLAVAKSGESQKENPKKHEKIIQKPLPGSNPFEDSSSSQKSSTRFANVRGVAPIMYSTSNQFDGDEYPSHHNTGSSALAPRDNITTKLKKQVAAGSKKAFDAGGDSSESKSSNQREVSQSRREKRSLWARKQKSVRRPPAGKPKTSAKESEQALRDPPPTSPKAKSSDIVDLPKEIALELDDPVSDLDQDSKYFPLRVVMAGDSATISGLDHSRDDDTLTTKEEDIDKYAPLVVSESELPQKRSGRRKKKGQNEALADSITEWTGEDTNDIAMDIMMHTCNKTPMGKMLVKNYVAQAERTRRGAPTVTVEGSSVELTLGQSREKFPSETMKGEAKSKSKVSKDKYAVLAASSSDEPCEIGVPDDVVTSVKERLSAFGESMTCLSPTSRALVQSKMMALSPTSKQIAEKSVQVAESRKQTPELIDLSGVDSLDDLDDDAVWMFQLTPKNETPSLKTKESKSNTVLELATERLQESDGNQPSALENVMNLAVSMLRTLDPEPVPGVDRGRVPLSDKANTQVIGELIDLTVVEETDAMVIVNGKELPFADMDGNNEFQKEELDEELSISVDDDEPIAYESEIKELDEEPSDSVGDDEATTEVNSSFRVLVQDQNEDQMDIEGNEGMEILLNETTADIEGPATEKQRSVPKIVPRVRKANRRRVKPELSPAESKTSATFNGKKGSADKKAAPIVNGDNIERDALDRVCEGAENLICGAPEHNDEQDADSLKEEDCTAIDSDPVGGPIEKANERDTQTSTNLSTRRDVLDIVFEGAESCVCGNKANLLSEETTNVNRSAPPSSAALGGLLESQEENPEPRLVVSALSEVSAPITEDNRQNQNTVEKGMVVGRGKSPELVASALSKVSAPITEDNRQNQNTVEKGIVVGRGKSPELVASALGKVSAPITEDNRQNQNTVEKGMVVGRGKSPELVASALSEVSAPITEDNRQSQNTVEKGTVGGVALAAAAGIHMLFSGTRTTATEQVPEETPREGMSNANGGEPLTGIVEAANSSGQRNDSDLNSLIIKGQPTDEKSSSAMSLEDESIGQNPLSGPCPEDATPFQATSTKSAHHDESSKHAVLSGPCPEDVPSNQNSLAHYDESSRHGTSTRRIAPTPERNVARADPSRNLVDTLPESFSQESKTEQKETNDSEATTLSGEDVLDRQASKAGGDPSIPIILTAYSMEGDRLLKTGDTVLTEEQSLEQTEVSIVETVSSGDKSGNRPQTMDPDEAVKCLPQLASLEDECIGANENEGNPGQEVRAEPLSEPTTEVSTTDTHPSFDKSGNRPQTMDPDEAVKCLPQLASLEDECIGANENEGNPGQEVRAEPLSEPTTEVSTTDAHPSFDKSGNRPQTMDPDEAVKCLPYLTSGQDEYKGKLEQEATEGKDDEIMAEEETSDNGMNDRIMESRQKEKQEYTPTLDSPNSGIVSSTYGGQNGTAKSIELVDSPSLERAKSGQFSGMSTGESPEAAIVVHDAENEISNNRDSVGPSCSDSFWGALLCYGIGRSPNELEPIQEEGYENEEASTVTEDSTGSSSKEQDFLNKGSQPKGREVSIDCNDDGIEMKRCSSMVQESNRPLDVNIPTKSQDFGVDPIISIVNSQASGAFAADKQGLKSASEGEAPLLSTTKLSSAPNSLKKLEQQSRSEEASQMKLPSVEGVPTEILLDSPSEDRKTETGSHSDSSLSQSCEDRAVPASMTSEKHSTAQKLAASAVAAKRKLSPTRSEDEDVLVLESPSEESFPGLKKNGSRAHVMSRVESARAHADSQEERRANNIDLSRALSASTHQTKSDIGAIPDEPSEASSNDSGNRLKMVLERLKESANRGDSHSVSSVPSDPEELFARYDDIVRNMNALDDKKVNQISSKNLVVLPAKRTAQSNHPPVSAPSHSKVPELSSFGSDVSATPSQNARELQTQLDEALQTSAAIRSKHEKMEEDLSSLQSRLSNRQRRSSMPSQARGSESYSNQNLSIPQSTLPPTTEGFNESDAQQFDRLQYARENPLLVASISQQESEGNLYMSASGSSMGDEEDEVRLAALDSIIHGLKNAEAHKKHSVSSAKKLIQMD